MLGFHVRVLAVIAALVMFCGSAALAEEVKCAGVIAKIEGQVITVKVEGGEQELTTLPSTKITLDNKPAQVTDLKVGYKVQCVSDREEKKSLCRSLDAVTANDS